MKLHQYLSILVLATMLTACSTENKSSQVQSENMAIGGLNYTIATVSSELNNIKLNGKVTYNEDELITFSPMSEGIVLKTFFSAGDYVQKGQKLLTVKSDTFYELQTEYKATLNEVYLATRNVNKAQQMYEDKLFSEQELIEANIELNKAKEEEERLNTAIKMYGQEVSKGIYQVNAQMTGYIFSKQASPSTAINPDSEVYTLGNLNNLWIMADVYTQDIAAVEAGHEVIISTSAYPNKEFKGTINRILPFIDSEDRVVKARVDFDNEGLFLKPEYTVEIKVQNKNIEGKLMIPTKCMVFDNNNFYAVIKQNNKLKSVKLDIHKQTGSYTFLNNGIQEGDSVLAENQLLYYTQLNQR